MSIENKNENAGENADGDKIVDKGNQNSENHIPDEGKKVDDDKKPENNGNNGGNEEIKPYIPENLPEHYHGKTNEEIIDKLFNAVDGFRKEQAKASKFPEKIDDYKIELGDLEDKILKKNDDGVDPIYEHMRVTFFENKVPGDVAKGIMEQFYNKAAEVAQAQGQNSGDDNISIDWDFKEYGGAEQAKPVIDGVDAWANGLKQNGKLSAEDMEEIRLLKTHSAGLKLLSKLRLATGEKPIPANFNGNTGNNAITEEDLRKRVADPRYVTGSRTFDKAFYEETTRMFNEFYGNKTA